MWDWISGLPVLHKEDWLFLQPTFGYLIGYIAGAFVVGWIIERIDNPKTYQFILASLAGLLVVYLIGVPYLYMALNVWRGSQAVGPMFG